jgi:predicted alpha/beta hydrolase family esterase
MKQQVLIIKGGESFESEKDYFTYLKEVPIDLYKDNKSWRDSVALALDSTHEFFVPVMPCKQNAQYEAWKIWFEKYLDLLNKEDLIIIAHSLGGTFMTKYLVENKLDHKLKSLHLIAPYVTDEFPLHLERLGTFKFDLDGIPNLINSAEFIHIWQSTDDDVVSFKNGEIVKSYLPDATLHTFEDRGHFNQPEFPELLIELKK